MDQASVTAALRLTPATAVTTSWRGSTMTVSPVHGFAPNSAYVLTIDHTVARTSGGGSPASDVTVTFGTAPVAQTVSDAGDPVKLSRTVLTAAEDGSEAVVTRDGSVLVTAAQQAPGGKGPTGLVRMTSAADDRLGAATPAICVSRSGRSIAYLTDSGAGTQIAFADSTGVAHEQVPAIVDPNTPLGWIGDDRVTFVSGGRLRSADRAGHVTTVLDSRLDAGDSVVLAPGGRYVCLAHGDTGSRIQTVDVPKGTVDPTSVVTAVAQAFANAQLDGDTGAQRAIAPGVNLPQLPATVTRAAVVNVRTTGNGTATTTVRLSVGPTSKDPVDRQATETLQLDTPGGSDVPRVSSVSVAGFAPAPSGPQLTRVDTRPVPGAVLLTFDCDLNPLTVPGAVAMLSAGSDVAVTAGYDAATRTIRVQPAASVSLGSVTATVMVTTALRDVAGNPMAAQLALPVQLGTASR
jgi:hypothetical protein